MNRQVSLAVAGAAILALASGVAVAKPAMATSNHSPAFSGHALAGGARISLAQARDIVLKARPGVITDQELEKEGGGSGLRYSFDVKAAGVTYEIGVDAKSGKVLQNDPEGKNPD